MFDEIRCEAPLPDGGPPEETYFQTKTFPSPCLQRYVITRSGRLLDSVGHDLEPDGYINFYTAGEKWREFRARFSAGQLVDIVCVPARSQHTYFGLASFRWYNAPSYLFGDPTEE
jgi:hypothetical protein